MDYILHRAGYRLTQGIDAVLLGNIPGGGMSRSASLTINLILSFFDANGIAETDGMKIVDLAQAVENEYIGSPCGKLDQIMIYFAKEGMGAPLPSPGPHGHARPLGGGAADFRIVSLDTGTVRPGLEKSTYKIRRAECETLAAMAAAEFGISCLADVRDSATYQRILSRFGAAHPDLCDRLRYIYGAQAAVLPHARCLETGRRRHGRRRCSARTASASATTTGSPAPSWRPCATSSAPCPACMASGCSAAAIRAPPAPGGGLQRAGRARRGGTGLSAEPPGLSPIATRCTFARSWTGWRCSPSIHSADTVAADAQRRISLVSPTTLKAGHFAGFCAGKLRVKRNP